MSRKSRHLELSLLLAVAPLVSSCEGPEDRHCVGPDGVYLGDACCEPHSACYVPGAHHVYVPRRHYTGTGTHAGAWRSSTSPSRSGSSHGTVSRGGFGHAGGGAHGGG